MRARIFLAVGLAAALAVLAVPGAAQADGSGHFCDSNALCMSMDGTSGHLVYGKPVANDNQEKTQVFGVFACTHGGSPSEYVQWTGKAGDSENCPFSTVGFDQQYTGDEIVKIWNYFFASYSQTRPTISRDVYQNSSASAAGEEWIKVPDTTYVNVLDTDDTGFTSRLCDTGSDNTLVSSILITGDACKWTF